MRPHLFTRLRRRLAGPPSPGHRRTLRDQLVARRLLYRFEHELAEADLHGLHFYVRDGVVTLHGTVRHALDGEMLADLVRGVTGVRRVVMHLHPATPPADAAPATP